MTAADAAIVIQSEEVLAARRANRPLVALESTIITHGMPRPQNWQTAMAVEDAVRQSGAVPATIAVIDGAIHIGLERHILTRLAETRDVMKLSRADLAYALSEKRTGSTTVAATMILAYRAGIGVFATGGIGGVHRGAGTTFDISADLDELARTPVTVVCAGAKAILDIAKTLEVLETKGVPVVTCGSSAFPAFWSRESGLASPLTLADAPAIARFLRARESLALSGGVLIANPVPHADAIPSADMERFICEALAAAERDGVTGKAVTPFLLDAICRLTDGKSLVTNIALVKNNARLAARISRAMASG